MEKMKKSKNYWPHAIIISILLIVVLCIYTIIESLKYPVEMDNFYFDTYQNVDKNFDKIRASQEAFDAKYNVVFKTNDAKFGELSNETENSIEIFVENKNGTPCAAPESVQIKLLITRPDTNRYNQNMNVRGFGVEACSFVFDPFKVELPGRWQFQAKISIGNDTGFFKYEANATKTAR